MRQIITLAELGLPEEDVGTAWHPRHADSYDERGNLLDLDDAAHAEHLEKPEAVMSREALEPLAAEDSQESPEDEV